jgi:hypothetical protein
VAKVAFGGIELNIVFRVSFRTLVRRRLRRPRCSPVEGLCLVAKLLVQTLDSALSMS